MKINSIKNNINDKNTTPAFKGMEMSPLSYGLYTLSNNDMLKAAGIDFFFTDNQRTLLELKNRGKNAGIEMGFREYTGTFIVEFSAALFAFLISKFMGKNYKPDVKINSSSWATNNALDVFNDIYKKSDKTPEGFVKNALNSMSGLAGHETKFFKNLDEEKTKPIADELTKIITGGQNKKETKQALKNVQDKIIGVLGADNGINIESGAYKFSSNLGHTLRDMTDLGKNVFFTNAKNAPDEIISKLKTINKTRTSLAIPLSMALAISNQYINRRLTKKRTGIDNFVGENGYEENVKEKNESKADKWLPFKKFLSAGIFVGMLGAVMGVKRPKDLVSKLEFTGPATTGSAIKTIYGTLILGRIFAAKDSTELRETDTRDYLGFLNWLVLGDFVSKGIAQVMDKDHKELFNVAKEGKGIKHWLKYLSLKSQKEIIASGKNVKSNLRKLNIAQLGGIAYSAVMLGFLLPKFNIWMTKRNKKDDNSNGQNTVQNAQTETNGKTSFQALKFEEFLKSAKMNSKTLRAIN